MSNTKRLAKNTIYMYIRMFLLMCISFYTSRVLLQELGVKDYGIYNLVGSVVAMFNSLRTLFATSTQRFLNYEMGSRSYENLPVVFNMSLKINLLISAIFIIVVECFGIWFFYNKINIEVDRWCSAFWVFHFSVISAALNILTTPYDAEIIAHERMDFFSIMSVIEGLLKLLIIFLLPILPYDKLFIYGFLLLLVSFIVRFVNSIFCKRNFEECRVKTAWNKDYFQKMTSFAGWNFLGNTAFALSQNGINMVLNTFCGPAVNAARGLSYQVTNSLQQIVSNVNVVVSPFFVKTYASNDKEKAFYIMFISSKVFFLLQLCIVIFFIFSLNILLGFWLDKIPAHTSDFLSLVLLYSLIRSLHSPIDSLFKANGDLKYYQLAEGVILALPILTSFLLLELDINVNSVFIAIVCVEILNLCVILILARNICRLPILVYLRNVILPCLYMLSLSCIFYYLNITFINGYKTIFFSIISIIIVLLNFYFVVLKKEERLIIKNILFKK